MYRIPDRWLEYSRCGEVIGDTGILASKTPLKTGFHRCKERPEGILPAEEFTPTQLVDYWKQKGQRIGLVVDLTFSYRYYDPKELRQLGVEHAKIPCPGQEIPDNEIYANFVEVLENQLALDEPGAIVVHCTHGVNRTGYLVCKFLIDHFSYTADKAIKAFNVARGHSMERENYISDIHDYWKYIQDGGSGRSDASFQPIQSRNRGSWEPPPWRPGHHHPYSDWRYSHRPQHDFYSQSYYYDPYHEHDRRYGYTDFCSKPNRSRDGSRFHHRGFSHRHPQPPRNQSPPKDQQFSKDQPPPSGQYPPVDRPCRAPPPRNQPPSKQHFSRDHSPHRNQPPLEHEHFSTDHSIPKDDVSPMNLTPPRDDSPVKQQPSPMDQPPKEKGPRRGQRRRGRAKATPKQPPARDQPPTRQSQRKRTRGTRKT